MSLPTIKFDFYEVVLPDAFPHTFEHLLNTLDTSADDESRTVEYYDHSLLRFQKGQQQNNVIIGEMLRIKMDQLPAKAKKSGRTTAIDLDDDEGVGEHTAFLFHPQTRTIVVQKSQAGVAPGAIKHYIESKTGIHPIAFNVRLQKETMQKLRGMQRIKTLEYTLGSVTNASLIQGRVGSVLGAIQGSNYLVTPSVSIKIDAGRGKRSNLGNEAKDQAYAILQLNTDVPGAVDKLVISGGADDVDKPEPLDLLEDKMVERIELPPQIGRGNSPADVRNAILQAWANRETEIISMTDLGN